MEISNNLKPNNLKNDYKQNNDIADKKDVVKDTDRIEKNKDFVRSEGFNFLRSKVRLCLRKKTQNKILVTSANAGEGKSTCVCNLAISFAKTGAKVLIVDCDLRKPVVHKTFGLSNKKGLADVLAELFLIEDCIQPTWQENLFVLSAGTEAPNPSELLGCEEFEKLIDDLAMQYDYLIFDSSPVNVVADAESILELVDGVILVTRYKKTTYSDLDEALQKLKFANTNLFGIFYYEKPVQKRSKYGYKKYSYTSKYGYYK